MALDPRSDFLILATPWGAPLLAEYDSAGVRALHFWRQGDHPPARTRDDAPRGDEVGRALLAQLREYFAGTRREFDLPLAVEGTEFRRRVWDALRRIPYGEVRTYGQVARELGSPAASRAIGQANRENRLPILIPCHRVVASGGIGGYAGSTAGKGIDTKRWLLRHEGGYRG